MGKCGSRVIREEAEKRSIIHKISQVGAESGECV